MMKSFDFQKMPIVDVLNEILVDSSRRGASDIHFDPFADYLLVRIRIDGILHDYTKIPNEVRGYLVTRIKTISRMNITESRIPQDGAIKATLNGVDLDLRVSALPVNGGEKVVIRILDYTRSMAGLDELSFSEKNFKKLLEMISVPNGIILVTGATGSGKSTTVYSILQHLNKSETNIITVEDPIEMDISGINQVQTNSKVGLTFASALRSILRQDPDIIMIGEIRDTETAKIAVRASITGHLVLSTLHTNTALNTIERLIDMDVQKYLLSSALEGVISQKLARRLCNDCKRKRYTTHYEKEIFKTVLGEEVDEIWEAEGCDKCHSGFSGRIPIHEVLKISQRIRDALGEDLPKEKFRDLVYGHGDVITMLQDGLEKVVEGHTTFGEILKLIELEDDDQISDNSALKEAILETKAALASSKDEEQTEQKTSQEINLNQAQLLQTNETTEQVQIPQPSTIIEQTQMPQTVTTNEQIQASQTYITPEEVQTSQPNTTSEQIQVPQYTSTEQVQISQPSTITEQTQVPQTVTTDEQIQESQTYTTPEEVQTSQPNTTSEQIQVPQYTSTEQVQISQPSTITEQTQVPQTVTTDEQIQESQTYTTPEEVQTSQPNISIEQPQISQTYTTPIQTQTSQTYTPANQTQILQPNTTEQVQVPQYSNAEQVQTNATANQTPQTYVTPEQVQATQAYYTPGQIQTPQTYVSTNQ